MNEPLYIAFIDESGCDGDKFGKGSSEFLAVERKKFGQYDDRYARILGEPILKSARRGAFGFGYKFWPAEAEKLYHADPRFAWIKTV